MAKIKKAKAVIEQRASDRYKKEKAEYDSKMDLRKKKEEATGKKAKGKIPKEPSDQPGEKDQYNFTDPESLIMKTSSGFNQYFNGQAAVTEDMVIVGAYSNSHANDKQEFIPAIESIDPKLRNEIANAAADTYYFSENNTTTCEEMKINPLISAAREPHNNFLNNIMSDDSRSENSSLDQRTPTEKMRAKLKQKAENEIYKKRKQTVEPVFGIIKEILGFRRFSLRGEAATNAEWILVCSAYNLKRFFKMQRA